VAAASGSYRCRGHTIHQASRTQSHGDLGASPSPPAAYPIFMPAGEQRS